MAGTDDEHAPARSVERAQGLAVEDERFAARRRLDAHATAFEIEDAGDELVARRPVEHVVDPVRLAERLLDEAKVAATGQAEARGFFLRPVSYTHLTLPTKRIV